MSRITGWAFVIGGVGLFSSRTTLAVSAARNWLDWHLLDPSGAELYAIDFWFEAAFAAAGAAAAGLGLWVVRRASQG